MFFDQEARHALARELAVTNSKLDQLIERHAALSEIRAFCNYANSPLGPEAREVIDRLFTHCDLRRVTMSQGRSIGSSLKLTLSATTVRKGVNYAEITRFMQPVVEGLSITGTTHGQQIRVRTFSDTAQREDLVVSGVLAAPSERRTKSLAEPVLA